MRILTVVAFLAIHSSSFALSTYEELEAQNAERTKEGESVLQIISSTKGIINSGDCKRIFTHHAKLGNIIFTRVEEDDVYYGALKEFDIATLAVAECSGLR